MPKSIQRHPSPKQSHSHVAEKNIQMDSRARLRPNFAVFDAPAPIPANPSRRKCVARAALTPMSMCRYARMSLTSIRTFDREHLIDRYWLDWGAARDTRTLRYAPPICKRKFLFASLIVWSRYKMFSTYEHGVGFFWTDIYLHRYLCLYLSIF